MTLRNKLYLAVSLPAGLSLGLFWLAAVEDGSDAQWMFRMAVTCAVAAVLFGCGTWSTHRVQEVECENVALRQRVRKLETGQEEIRQTVNSKLAVQAWRDAGMTGTDAAPLRLVPADRRANN